MEVFNFSKQTLLNGANDVKLSAFFDKGLTLKMHAGIKISKNK